LQLALSALGVQWHFGATVQSVERVQPEMLAPSSNASNTYQNAHALQVTLSNGTVVHADSVLSAIGLRADPTLAQATGLRCGRGILVDTRLQTSAPNIFALGDGAQYASAPGAPCQDADAPGYTLPYVMPIMTAARALALTLAGTPTDLVFPLMPVAIKTPALPITIAPAAPGTQGRWHGEEPGLWQFLDTDNIQRGFTLTGAHTSRRMEQMKRTQA
jgi:rubredoxin-NAD+ reductase